MQFLLLLIIVPAFVIGFGLQGYSRFVDDPSMVAKVCGAPVTQQEYLRAQEEYIATLRSQLGPWGLTHEPQRFDAARLLSSRAVDGLLWLSSFQPDAPPSTPPGLPRIVVGHPQLATVAADVFIPVRTPGLNDSGHLFRTDGVVLMPLHAALPSPLPAATEVFRQIGAALPARVAA